MQKTFLVLIFLTQIVTSFAGSDKPEELYDFGDDGIVPKFEADVLPTADGLFFVGTKGSSGEQLFVLNNGHCKQLSSFYRFYPHPEKKRKEIRYEGGEFNGLWSEGDSVFANIRDYTGQHTYLVDKDTIKRVSFHVYPNILFGSKGITKNEKGIKLEHVIGKADIGFLKNRKYNYGTMSATPPNGMIALADSNGEVKLIRVQADTINVMQPIESPMLRDIVDITSYKGAMMFLGRPEGDDRFQLGQIASDDYVLRNFWTIRECLRMFVWNEKLIIAAKDRYGHFVLYTYVPPLPPQLINEEFLVWSNAYFGKEIGKVRLKGANYEDCIFELTDAPSWLKIHRYDGILSIGNEKELGVEDTGIVMAEVKVRVDDLSNTGKICLTVRPAPSFDYANVEERLMFFPYPSQKNVLTTGILSDGAVVRVFDFDLTFVDELEIADGKLVLGEYKAGYYILSCDQNGKNYIQKIAVN